MRSGTTSHQTLLNLTSFKMRKATTCDVCKVTFPSKKLWSEHLKDGKCIRIEDDVVPVNDDLPEEKTVETIGFLSNESSGFVDEEDEKVEGDDDIQVVKSSIYKYHGDLNYKQQVKGDYFSFKYFDDFEDNDDVILVDEEEDSEDLEMEEAIEQEYTPMKESDDAGEQKNNMEIGENIPIQKMEMKQFPGGNFFMLAC